MAGDYERANEVWAEGRNMPRSATSVALLEEAVRLFDSLGDLNLAEQSRNDLIEHATFAARPDLSIVHFSWCLARADQQGRGTSRELLWQYKWIIGAANKFASISRLQIENMIVDLTRRFQEAGESLKPVWKLKRDLYEHTGEVDLMLEAHRNYHSSSRGSLSDCAACVQAAEAEHFALREMWEECVKAAEPLYRGNSRCASQPHSVLAHLLVPLLRLKQYEDADHCQIRGMRLINGKPNFVEELGLHIIYLTLVGRYGDACRVIVRNLPHAYENVSAHRKFDFYRGMILWLDLADEKTLKKGMKQICAKAPFVPKETLWTPKQMRDWLTSEIEATARDYDARNGTQEFRRRLGWHQEFLTFAEELKQERAREGELSSDS